MAQRLIKQRTPLPLYLFNVLYIRSIRKDTIKVDINDIGYGELNKVHLAQGGIQVLWTWLINLLTS
jgi:hypothetical protein